MSDAQLIIFDCDGVLVDSEPLAMRILLEVIEEAGLKLTPETAIERFLGRSMTSISQLLRGEFGLDFGEASLEAMRSRLYKLFRSELAPIASIAEVVSALNIKCCVASSSQFERIELALEVTDLLPLFKGRIYSASMVRAGKPAPDLFLHAAKSMGVDPSRCIVIEDSPAGVIAAKSAGMTVFAFTGGGHATGDQHLQNLARLNPDKTFSDMRDLPRLLSEMSRHKSIITPDDKLVVGVDVGTTSARAGIFNTRGDMFGRNEHPIAMNQTKADFAEHDSQDIWLAVCNVVRRAIALSGAIPDQITGISFDATCSLVLRDKSAAQISVATNGDPRWDTICWLDHRALKEADECTATGHRVLDYIGEVMSPEMEIPKLMWVKRNLPDTWNNLGLAFDLADFLTWKASGSLARSQCTLACKWTFLPHESEGWQSDFLDCVGLGDLIEKADLPKVASPVGNSLGRLTAEAANSLGLTVSCQVGTGLIDAYGGAIGVLGAFAQNDGALDTHLALIAGTSSCVMTMSHESRLTRGVWGPYYGACLPGFWINEGGQSATGALLDHVIRVHSAGVEPNPTMHAKIIQRIGEMRLSEGRDLASRLHILPDFHGNRSPMADPHALGVISGLSIDTSFDGLCKLYWRAAVSIVLGIRHILDTLNASGHIIDTLHVTGGHVRNPLLMELYADATGCKVIEPVSEDATLLGTAMVAAAAAGLYPSLTDACAGMYKGGRTREPDASAAGRFDKDYAIFLAMQRHRAEIDALQ